MTYALYFALGFTCGLLSLLALAVWLHFRSEKAKRADRVDAIMARVAGDYPSTQIRDSRVPHMAPYSKRPH